ncbi:MAG TPA: V-type ATP synthase subunit E [Candidatus Binatia bacterium]|nr:V-type ATP synthase subunit E [Candidatus Binatia bacterium]
MTNQPDTLSGSEDLVDLIRQQCVGEIAALRTEAAERAERIRASAVAEAETLRGDAQALGETRGRQATAKRLAVAETDSRRAWLWAREQLIDEVLNAARDRLSQFPHVPDARRIVHDLIVEALQVLPSGPVCVRVPAAVSALIDPPLCATLGGDRWQITVISDHAPAHGVVAESADGRLRFDNSFDARLRRGRDHLRRLVLDTLLGGEAPEW